MVWQKEATLEAIRAMGRDTMMEYLGIEVVEIGGDFLRARMPVTARSVQPMRLLHGGASVVLAETLGSIAAHMSAGPDETAVGMEVNANHVRGVGEGGAVVATARPLHLGRRTQVWEIRVEDEATAELVCVSRLTLATIPVWR